MHKRVNHLLWAALAAQLAAFWPVWVWYAQRFAEGVDEPWGILALATAAAVILREGRQTDGSAPALNPPGVLAATSLLLVLYIAGHAHATPVMRGLVAITTVTLTASRLCMGRLSVGLWGLAVLSLPLSSAMQFYLGYPVRCATAALAVPLLQLGGLAVEQAGTILRFGSQHVWVDAPCSGVRMLWTGTFLAMALACLRRLSAWRTLALGASAMACIFLGNVMRAMALFHLETSNLGLGAWAHSGVGAIVFAATAIAIAAASSMLAPRPQRKDPQPRPTLASQPCAC